jgi:hypothetical protein
MADSTPVAFTAVQKLTVAPDRHYRFEVFDDGMQLTKIGSQFAGMDAASPDDTPTGMTMQKKIAFIIGGIAITIVSVILLIVFGKNGTVVMGFIGTAAAGVIMAIVGAVKPTPDRIASGRDNLVIVLSDIRKFELTPHPRKTVPATLTLEVASQSKPMKFLIEAEEDLKTAQRHLAPRLKD